MQQRIIFLLRWSERYTKTDMVYLVKNSFWVFVGQMATSLSAFVVMVALANLVDKAEYGEYRFVIAIILILSVFNLPGMNTAMVQSTARNHEEQMGKVIKTRMRWSLIATGFSLFLAGYYYFQGNFSLGLAFLVVALVFPLYNTFFIYYFYLHGKQLFNQATLAQAFTRIIFMVVMLVVAFLSPQMVWLIIGYMSATILMQYIGYRWTIKNHKHPSNIDSDLISYGKYLSLYSAPSLVASQISIIVIWHFMGDVESAIYAIAIMIPMECNRIGSIVNQVAIPKMSKQEVDINALFRKILKLELVFFTAWIAYVLLAPYVFHIFFPKYPEAIPYSIIAMLMILLVPRIMLHGLMNAKKMKKEICQVSIIVPIIQIILTLIMIPLFGIWGAIVAMLLGWTIEYLYLIFLVKSHT